MRSDLIQTRSIVFIHGLTGGRESTWTAKGAAAPWPESLLSNDLPQARIIMYGYDADVVNFWSMTSQNTVGDHSQKFLTSLANLRDRTDTVCSLSAIEAAQLIVTTRVRDRSHSLRTASAESFAKM